MYYILTSFCSVLATILVSLIIFNQIIRTKTKILKTRIFELEMTAGEKNNEFLEKLLNLKQEYREKINDIKNTNINEIEKAKHDARETLRFELEKQGKLFSIEVHPYLKSVKNKGWFSNESELKIGRQYQLFVSGVPSFQPHIQIEKTVVLKVVDEELKKKILNASVDMVKTLTEQYLNFNKFIKVRPAIIE